MKSFPIAPMSRDLMMMTAGLLALLVGLMMLALYINRVLWLPATLLVIIYVLIALWFRPTRFEVNASDITIHWPLRTARIPCQDIRRARVLDADEMKAELGCAIRIGAGGFLGGFGLLHTARAGMVRFYISRTDEYVWIEMRQGRHWLITPADAQQFVQALAPVR